MLSYYDWAGWVLILRVKWGWYVGGPRGTPIFEQGGLYVCGAGGTTHI